VYMAYSDLFMYVDNDKVDQARVAQDKFLEQAKTLEVSVVTKKYVAPLKETLKKYHTKRLNISAPLTYKKAQTEIEKTELTVKSDSRDFDAIEKS
ncbi:ATPase, partial [Vibrio splendidus]